ncbi:carboxypeptidase regulatory-like domain-containing protein, partial [Planctomycetota bacterium]
GLPGWNHNGRSGAHQKPVQVGDGDWWVLVELAEETVSLTGSVRDQHGKEMAGVWIAATLAPLEPPLAPPAGRVATGRDGRFSVSGLQPGRYAVTFTAPGFVDLRREVDLRDGGTAPLEVTLERGGSLRVTLLDSYGLVVPDAHVVATDADGRTYERQRRHWARGTTLSGLSLGTYDVLAVSERCAYARWSNVHVDGDVALEATTSAGGALEIVCLDPAGSPLPRLQLELSEKGSGVPVPHCATAGRHMSDANGRIRRTLLRAGAYEGSVKGVTPTGIPVLTRFGAKIADGKTTQLSLSLRIGREPEQSQ